MKVSNYALFIKSAWSFVSEFIYYTLLRGRFINLFAFLLSLFIGMLGLIIVLFDSFKGFAS